MTRGETCVSVFKTSIGLLAAAVRFLISPGLEPRGSVHTGGVWTSGKEMQADRHST